MYKQKNKINTRKKLWLTATVLIALLLITTPVFAEGEDPAVDDPLPAETEPVEETAAVESEESTTVEVTTEDSVTQEPVEDPAPDETTEPVPAEEAATEEPIDSATGAESTEEASEADVSEETTEDFATEEPLVEETVVKSEQTSSESASVEESTSEEAEIVNAEGEALVLASEESAELLASADPYYTVGLDTYRFYDGAGPVGCAADPFCFEGQGSDVIQDALNYMSTSGLPTDRKLYVEGGVYDGFDVNGFSDPTVSLLNGVIGVDGSGSTLLSTDVNITDTLNGFTLSGFTLDTGASIYFGNNIGSLVIEDVYVQNSTDTYAIQVTNHSGSVSMEGVNVSNNVYSGANIDNTAGTYPVTIVNSAFNSNGGGGAGSNSGLAVDSLSTITLNGVAACGNNGNGINILEYRTLKMTDIYLYGNQSPSFGYGRPLSAQTSGTGTAYLEHVYAYDNDFALQIEGGSLKAKHIEVNNTLEDTGMRFNSPVGSARIEFGNFHHNYYDGLYMLLKGSVYLSSIQANENQYGAGVFIDNAYWTGSEYIGTGSVKVTSPKSGGAQKANSFSSNNDSGITINSQKSVNISNFDAWGNGSIGVVVDNEYGIGSVTLDVTIPGWANYASYNDGDGINIDSNGTVTVKKTVADENDGDGLDVVTKGSIKLQDFTAQHNRGKGADLNNYNAFLPKNVKIINSRFDHNHGDGLEVDSKGSITAYGLTATGNSLRDTYIGAYSSVATYRDVLGADWIEDVYKFDATAGDWVDLNLESFDFDAYLVLVDPDGLIEEEDNDDWYDSHAYIGRNVSKTGTYTVVVLSLDHSGFGEYMFSLNDAGHSSVNNFWYHGADLDNDDGTRGVTIKKPKNYDTMWGNFFDLNSGYGLEINSNASIKVYDIAASQNLNHGINFTNSNSRGSVIVAKTRRDDFHSDFSSNGGYGIYITTLGNVTLKNVSAWDNENYGAYIDNCQYSAGCQGFGGVKISASSNQYNNFGWNGFYGLYITSGGSIQLVNTYAEGNPSGGAYLYNQYDGVTAGIKITTAGREGWNGFYSNGNQGLYARTNGNIYVKRVDAEDNAGSGMYLRNTDSPNSPYVKIYDAYLYYNDGYGVEVRSKGHIYFYRGTAMGNEDWGAYLTNELGEGNVFVNGTAKETMQFSENGWTGGAGNGGLWIRTLGSVKVGYANAETNNGRGIQIENHWALTPKSVQVNDVEVNRNLYDGLYVSSMGSIKVSGINAQENGWHGAYLDNDEFGAVGGVTVKTTRYHKENWLSQNQNGSGLYITSAGSVEIQNTSASGNDQYGIYVYNTAGTGNVTYKTTLKQNFWLEGNGYNGLYVYTLGNITIKNKYELIANGNGSSGGINLDNAAGVLQNVFIENVTASHNWSGNGIAVNASGNIKGKSLTAHNNDWDGIFFWSVDGYVTITGSNNASDNGESGLSVEALNGYTTINGFTAWANNHNGIYIDSGLGDIKVTNTIAAHNRRSGLVLVTDGNFYIDKVKSFFNGHDNLGTMWDDGLHIIAGSTSLVTIKNSTFMTNWWGSGIEIYHPNPTFWPTLYKVNYESNGGPNIYVHN